MKKSPDIESRVGEFYPAAIQCEKLNNLLVTDFSKKTMSFIGFITDLIAKKFCEDLTIFERSKTKIAILLFKSTGGYFSAVCSRMRDKFRASPVLFEGHNAAFAYSTAAMLIQWCNWRSASKDSLMMIHWPTPLDNEKKVLLTKEQNEERIQWWFSIFSERSGKSLSFIRQIADKKLTAAECLKYNLIDEIRELPP